MGTSENSRTTSAPPPSPAAGLDDRLQPPQRWLSWSGLCVALFALIGGVVLSFLGIDDARRAGVFDMAVQAAALVGVVAVTNPHRERTFVISIAVAFVVVFDLGFRIFANTDNAIVQTITTALLVFQATSPMWLNRESGRGQKGQSTSAPSPTPLAPGEQGNLEG